MRKTRQLPTRRPSTESDAAVEDDRRTPMLDDRSVGYRVRHCLHLHGSYQTDGRRVIAAVRHRTRERGNDDPGYLDSWGEPTAGQRIGVARLNSVATPSEVDSRSGLGCLAASVSCWSCPHQVGEGNLLLHAPESLGPQGGV